MRRYEGGPKSRSPNGGKPPNYPKGWCYLCSSEHLYLYPCPELARMRWFQP
jgi:hypothetical protein